MPIIARCPECQGSGQVPKDLPLAANPRAPMTRSDKVGLKTCPRCRGTGSIGIKR
jgi:hypothetical protein